MRKVLLICSLVVLAGFWVGSRRAEAANMCGYNWICFDDFSTLGVLGVPDSFERFIQNTGFASYDLTTSPGDLPGGNDYNFISDWHSDTESSAEDTRIGGINNGDAFNRGTEWLEAFFEAEYDNVVEAFKEGMLIVGFHTQDFSGRGRKANFKNRKPDTEPVTVLLLGFGLLGFATVGRRRMKKQ